LYVPHRDVIIVRWADVCIVGFEHESDARRFFDELRERLAKFGLELQLHKTGLLEFGRYAAQNRRARASGNRRRSTSSASRTFARSQGGRFWLKRITIAKWMRAKLRQVNDHLKARRHLPIPEQGRWLAAVVRGHQA
jgi:RNA-directed DNA polymerase